MAWRWFLVGEDVYAVYFKHHFELTFYFMWVWTIAFLGIMAYVAVKHL